VRAATATGSSTEEGVCTFRRLCATEEERGGGGGSGSGSGGGGGGGGGDGGGGAKARTISHGERSYRFWPAAPADRYSRLR